MYFSEISVFSRSSEEWSQLLYDNRTMCSIPAPFYYSIGLSGAHIFSVPIYFLSFFALSYENSSNFQEYKRFLAFHAISNFLFEFYLSIAMKPVLYLPYRVTRFSGAYFLRHLNAGFIFIIFLIICVLTAISIMEMINYRFKLITEICITEKWVRFCVKILKIWRFSIHILSCLVIVTISMCIGGLFEQQIIKESFGPNFLSEYPEIMCVSALAIPIGAFSELKPIHIFNFVTCFSIVFGCLMCFIEGIVALSSLQKIISKCSPKTVQMHRTLLYSIFVQISVHVLMLGIPILIYIIAMLFNFDGNVVGYFAIILASLHGAMSTLAMLIFNRPLFEVVKNLMAKFFTPNFVHRGTVSFVSIETTQKRKSVLIFEKPGV